MCACEDEEGRMCMRGGRVWCVMRCGVGGCVTNGLEEISVLRVCVCVCEGGSCACVDGTELNSIAFPHTPIPMDASRPLLTIKYS